MGLNIVQIGSYKGNDDLTNIVKRYSPKEINKIILIEPQKEFNQFLIDCYKDYNFFIENIVITPNQNENKIKFYTCVEDYNKEISSIFKSHISKHGQNNFIESEFNCLTINDLLVKHNIINLDLLFIDAEGVDDKIIKSIDFNMFNIKKIFYENLHIDNQDLIFFLNSKNYIVNQNKLTNEWSNEAIKRD